MFSTIFGRIVFRLVAFMATKNMDCEGVACYNKRVKRKGKQRKPLRKQKLLYGGYEYDEDYLPQR